MSEPEKRENSVLFSLRELRQIEDDRVDEETERARHLEEERIRAQSDAERRAKAEEDARRQAEQGAIRAKEEAEAQRRREEELKVQEAEAKARVAAQTELEKQRLQQEMALRKVEAEKKRPTVLIAAVLIMAVFAAGLVFYVVQKTQEADRERAALQAEREDLERKFKQAERRMDELQTQLKSAPSEEERADLERQLAAERARRENLQQKIQGGAEAERKAPVRAKRPVKAKSDEREGTINLSKECIDNPLHPSCK